jgi:hypothetical protein
LQGKLPAEPGVSPQWGSNARRAELEAMALPTDAASASAVDDDENDMVDMIDPATGEWGGPTRGGSLPEPTRFGDWERKGRVSDF